jgi:uncharacterized protein (DUF488 family)
VTGIQSADASFGVYEAARQCQKGQALNPIVHPVPDETAASHERAAPADPRTVWTIGHSTHDAGTFVGLLLAHRVQRVIDVRRFPGSRRHPQFGSIELSATLARENVDYLHLAELGGRRVPRVDSANMEWRNAGFRGYADHMASRGYRDAFEQVIDAAANERCALMCAEVLWWQCHRSMIADDLVLHHWPVVHILGDGKLAGHSFRVPARLVGDVPVYDGRQPGLF